VPRLQNLDWYAGFFAGRRGDLALCPPPSRARSPSIADLDAWHDGHEAGSAARARQFERAARFPLHTVT